MQTLLLKLFFSKGLMQPNALNKEDWNWLIRVARQHRLGPMLHWNLRPVLPLSEAAELAESFKHSTLRALALQHELRLICRSLERAGIPYLALKGAFLAFHAYPHPGLRPMRDLDILVPEELVLRAHEVLLEGGLVRLSQYQYTPESQLTIHKHLPPLCSASGQVQVDLHFRLLKPSRDWGELVELSDDPAFWQRAVSIPHGREFITYPSPTDLLLHLIIHAVYDHNLENGPLLLSDIAYLLKTQDINWALFWKIARQSGYQRGCCLALRLVEQYCGYYNIEYGDMEDDSLVAGPILDAATLLMLRELDDSHTSFVVFAHDLLHQPSTSNRLSALIRKVIPPKAWVSEAYSVPEDYRLLPLSYLRHWWRLAFDRLPKYCKSRAAIREEIQQSEVFKEWLRG